MKIVGLPALHSLSYQEWGFLVWDRDRRCLYYAGKWAPRSHTPCRTGPSCHQTRLYHCRNNHTQTQ